MATLPDPIDVEFDDLETALAVAKDEIERTGDLSWESFETLTRKFLDPSDFIDEIEKL